MLKPGPSPRGWGEPGTKGGPDRGGRTIPTRVGRTTYYTDYRRIGEDHPHAGGENAERQSNLAESEGPSPRGWGEPRFRWNVARYGRTIPTRVGRTHRMGLFCQMS